MAMDFFEKEVMHALEGFNRVFGKRTVCDLRERYEVIHAMCWMDMLAQRVREAGTRDSVTTQVRQFLRVRNVLRRYFDLEGARQRERRLHGQESAFQKTPCEKIVRNGAVHAMRKHLQD